MSNRHDDTNKSDRNIILVALIMLVLEFSFLWWIG